MILFAAILGAFANRARGGLISILYAPKDNPSKYDWVGDFIAWTLFGGLCFYLTGAPLAILVGGAGLFLGGTFGWGKYLHAILKKELSDRAHKLDFMIDWVLKDDKYIQYRGVAAMGIRGAVWTSIIALSLCYWNLDFLYLAPVGLLVGALYYAMTFITDDTAKQWAWGEYLTGALLYGATYLIGNKLGE